MFDRVQTPARVTVITSTDRLSKRYALEDGGGLLKQAGGAMAAGHAQVIEVADLDAFAAVLKGLETSQALVYGTPERQAVGLVTKRRWHELGRPDDPIPRTTEAFSWPSGAGVMMADYDPDRAGAALDRADLLKRLFAAVPQLEEVAALWWPSSSSHIVNTTTGEDVTGLRGQRLYWIAQDAADIPRAGAALQVHLWAAGLGWVEVGGAGQLLRRTILDASVWQTNRLDFAAGAECAAPLEQCRGEPVQVGGIFPRLDTRTVIPDPDPAVKAAAEKAIRDAEVQARPEADAARKRFIEERAHDMAGADDETLLEQCRDVVRRALSAHVLAGDYPVTLAHDDGSHEAVTVGDVLDNPEHYHGCLTLDPIEPEYEGGKVVGKLYLMGARPRLYSFAHGGRTFTLSRPPARVELVKGRTVDAVERVLEIMRRAPDVYDFGGPLVTASDGVVQTMDENGLRHWMGGATQFWRWHKVPNGEGVELLEDPPAQVAKQVLSLGAGRRLKQLEAIITAPTIRLDGSILDLPGFDEATGLLLEIDGEDARPVPANPTAGEVEAALDRLMTPFRDFPLVGPVDRGVLLAALLTAAARPTLATAPAFGFDAPTQGSGKTLLAKCVALLALGHVPTVWPHTHGRDDEEIRKRIMSILLTGTRAVIWDNVIGTFDSAALAGALTSRHFSDRILGRSQAASVPNKAIWLLTGNNLTLAGDLPRRVLKCRIDPETDRPYARQFDLDPEAYCLRNRQRMVADALTIIRAWRLSGAERAPGNMASFEDWDSMVRQAVAWIARRNADYADPMQAVDQAQAADPEQEQLDTLLTALVGVFGAEPFESKQVKAAVDQCRTGFVAGEATPALADCIAELQTGRNLTTVGIGKMLTFRADRVVNGRRLRKRAGRNKSVFWTVEPV